MLWGNTAYCVKLSGEYLSRYSLSMLFVMLDHESGALYLLLFVTQTRPCTSGNSWKRFSLSDSHGTGDVELASL